MSRTENIDNAIWQDNPFADLSAPAKLVYIWSWTNQLCGMAGLYKVRQQQIELDTGQTRGAVTAALDELRCHGLVVYLDGVMWVVARVKRLVSRTPQIAKSIAKDVAGLAVSHPLRKAFIAWHWESRWPGDELRERFRSDGQPTITRGSLDVHETADAIDEIVKVTRGSVDPLKASVKDKAVATASEEKVTTVARDDVADVWDHYLRRLYSDGRGKLPQLADHRRIVAAARKVATVDECKLAIDGLAASEWHRQNGWRGIRYALHGNQNARETDRERIENMIERATTRPTVARATGTSSIDDRLAEVGRRLLGTPAIDGDIIEGRAA